ncbi:MAG: hypothetical protein GX053_15320 [Tissierella sp.]|nr:hypothetical protein [Tissierella sp.]
MLRGAYTKMSPVARDAYKKAFKNSDVCPVCDTKIEDGEYMIMRMEGLYHPKCYKEVVKDDLKEVQEINKARD